MRWWQWVLVLLLLAGALRALVDLGEEPDTSTVGYLPGDEDATGDGPELGGGGRAAGAERGAMGAARPASTLPEAMADALERLAQREAARRLWHWVRADPRRVLDLIAHELAQLEPLPNRGHPNAAVRYGAQLIEAWRKAGIAVDLQPHLQAMLAEAEHDESTVMGLLGMLQRLPNGEPAPHALLRTIAFDGRRGSSARLRAAHMLVIRHGLPETLVLQPDPELSPEDLRALRELLLATAENENSTREFGFFVSALRTRREILDDLMPGLLAAAERPGVPRWARTQLLGMILLCGDLDADRRTQLRATLANLGPRPKRSGEVPLLRGDIDKALAWMETAPALRRIEGVKVMMERGVEPERLHPHVLAVLRGSSPTAAEAAINAIALVQVPDHAVLGAVEPMLRGKSEAMQTRGVKALGLVARNPGDHDAAIDRLYAICRDAERPKVRIVAVQSILMHEARPRPMIGLLGQLLGDSAPEVRREAADALGGLAGEHADARHVLEGARNDSDDDVRELIAYWLDETDDDDK